MIEFFVGVFVLSPPALLFWMVYCAIGYISRGGVWHMIIFMCASLFLLVEVSFGVALYQSWPTW